MTDKTSPTLGTLGSATQLLAPVRGTSDGSIYHTVLIGPRFNLAVRHEPGSEAMALRAEPRGSVWLTGDQLVLTYLGLVAKSSGAGAYASRHFSLGWFRLAQTLGSVIVSAALAQMSYNKGVVLAVTYEQLYKFLGGTSPQALEQVAKS